MGDRDLVKKHFQQMLREAEEARVPRDVLGRYVLQELTELWLQGRSPGNVASELRFAADHLAGDDDFTFMRP